MANDIDIDIDIDIVIIGAGVVGLAVASEVARRNRKVYIIEKKESFGRDTSSRNSGTIHTSILSPRGSLNAGLCFEGNAKLYELCRKYNIDYRRTGKLLIALDDNEVESLDALFLRQDEGIKMQKLSRRQMVQLDPEVNGRAALLLTEAGVVDPYALMNCYLALAISNGAQLVCKSEVVSLQKMADSYRVDIRDSAGVTQVYSRVVINCAGLYSDKVAAMVGIDIVREDYQLNYFKGEYYSICSGKAQRMGQRLIYPMLKSGGIVGIHTVLDTNGHIRLGPDFYPVQEIDYFIDDSRRDIFLEGVRKLFSFVTPSDIEPESAGVMPRLYAKYEKFKEFMIRHEIDKGLPGFINVLGIESPGLTASPAIAKYVGRLVNEIITPF